MNTENTEPRKYNRYDENFKRSAVELLLQGGKSVATIATELGISTQVVKATGGLAGDRLGAAFRWPARSGEPPVAARGAPLGAAA